MYLLSCECVCIYPLCEAVEARCEFCVQRANVIALLSTLHQKKNISVAWAESVAMLTHKPINSSSSISGMQLKNTDTHTHMRSQREYKRIGHKMNYALCAKHFDSTRSRYCWPKRKKQIQRGTLCYRYSYARTTTTVAATDTYTYTNTRYWGI